MKKIPDPATRHFLDQCKRVSLQVNFKITVSGVRGREAPNAHTGFHNDSNMFVTFCHSLYPCLLMFFTHDLHTELDWNKKKYFDIIIA